MHRLRIVTFNIAHGRGLSPLPGLHGRRRFERNLRKIARLFDELEPDIVALQEIDENSRWSGSFDHLDYLNAFADFPYAVFGVNNRRGGGYQLNYGNAILSRHPIRAWENITFGRRTVGEKGFLFAEIDCGGRLLPVVNLHLHYRSRVHRFRQIEMLMEYLNAKHEPAIPTGPPRRSCAVTSTTRRTGSTPPPRCSTTSRCAATIPCIRRWACARIPPCGRSARLISSSCRRPAACCTATWCAATSRTTGPSWSSSR